MLFHFGMIVVGDGSIGLVLVVYYRRALIADHWWDRATEGGLKHPSLEKCGNRLNSQKSYDVH